MIGKEIADAIAPIVMWVAIVGGIILAGGLLIRQWNKRVVAEDDLGEAREAAEDSQEAETGIEERVDDLNDAFDAELQNDKNS